MRRFNREKSFCRIMVLLLALPTIAIFTVYPQLGMFFYAVQMTILIECIPEHEYEIIDYRERHVKNTYK